ncbi:MAG: hypothetical protein HYS27_03495 [Deltaproteobacteria bacterium]|nr:hypothetical protein [Deltaproteobacteria bacterium]
MTTKKTSAKGRRQDKVESAKGVRARLGPAKAEKSKVLTSKLKKSAKGAVSLPASKMDVASIAIASAAKGLPKVRVKAVVAQARKSVATKPLRPRRAAQSELIASEIAQAMLGEMAAGDEGSVLARQAARSQRERELLNRLAVSVQRLDDVPNLELAADIVQCDDADALRILVAVIERHDDHHAPDAARVIFEVGTRAPELLQPLADRLIAMCEDSQKEMLPYTMYALSPIAHLHSETLWDMRDLFWSALTDLTLPASMAQAGSVRLLSALCAAGPDYARTLAGGLVDLLGKCMPKDVAFFAESVLPALGTAHSHRAKPVLDRRMKELMPAEVARLRRAVRAAQTGQPIFAAA